MGFYIYIFSLSLHRSLNFATSGLVLTRFDCVGVVALSVVLLPWKSSRCGVVVVEEPWVLG